MSNTAGWGPSGPYGGSPGGWGWAPPPPPPKPGVIPLAPLGVESILGGAFATMRRYAAPLFGLAALAYAVLGALVAGAAVIAYAAVRDRLEALIDHHRDVHWADVQPLVFAFLAVWVFAMLALMVASALVQASCVATVHDAVLGRRATFRSVWRRAWPRTPSVIGVALLQGLVAVVPMLLVAAVFVSLTLLALSSWSALPAGIAFLLLLGAAPVAVWLYTLFSFAPCRTWSGFRSCSSRRPCSRTTRRPGSPRAPGPCSSRCCPTWASPWRYRRPALSWSSCSPRCSCR